MEKFQSEFHIFEQQKDVQQQSQTTTPLVKSRQTIRRVNNLSFISTHKVNEEEHSELGIHGDSIPINLTNITTDFRIPSRRRDQAK